MFKNYSIFPFGTLLSNVSAGFFIGLIIGADMMTNAVSPKMKLFFVTGLLGGLSTFSAFSLETVSLFTAGRYMACGLNICLNLCFSILGVAIGLYITKVFLET